MFARRTGWSLEENTLTREVERRRALDLPLIDLTESNPTRCGFEYDSGIILQGLADPAAMLYRPEPHGALQAREAVVEYYAARAVKVDLEQVFLTSSTSEAYSYLFRLLADPGDSVLVPRPSYPLFDFLTGLNDVEMIPYRLLYGSSWSVDLETLSAGLAGADRTSHLPRAIVAVHPNNPTGSFIRSSELATMVELCKKHDLAIIADEVFADYTLGEGQCGSHAGLDSVLTFTLSGLSKVCALPQMKLAWIVVNGPKRLREAAIARLEIVADTYLPVNAPVAASARRLLDTRYSVQPQIIARVRRNLTGLDRQLSVTGGVRRLQVEGGWYAVLEIPSGHSGSTFDQNAAPDAALLPFDEQLAVTLVREDGVLVHPGHFYEFDSDRFLVLSLIPPSAAFSEGIAKIVKRLDQLELGTT